MVLPFSPDDKCWNSVGTAFGLPADAGSGPPLIGKATSVRRRDPSDKSGNRYCQQEFRISIFGAVCALQYVFFCL
jgi:hypothetical protein